MSRPRPAALPLLHRQVLLTLAFLVAAAFLWPRAFFTGDTSLLADSKPVLGDYRSAPPFILCGSTTTPDGLHDPALAVRNKDGSPRPVAQIVSSEPLSHAPGKRITIALVTFAPGAWSPPHIHGGTVNVWVLKGTVKSQLNSGPMEVFTPGGTFFEPIGGTHTYSGNVSTTEEAQILAIFVHEEGATLTTYLDD